MKKSLLNLCKTIIDTVLPPRCAATGEIVDTQGMLSPAFWSQLQFIEAPFCNTCGMPFGFALSADTPVLCAACLEREPVFDHARAAVIYNDASRDLVLGFKYGDRLHAVHTFAPWMIRAGQALIDGADFIIPVPLHNRRLRARRFNQSALLGKEIARRTKKSYIPDALLRIRHTIPQKGLSARERNKNVEDAFAVRESNRPRFQGKNILLVDDVYTTGATLNECTRTLKAAGAETVCVLTVARVTKEEF